MRKSGRINEQDLSEVKNVETSLRAVYDFQKWKPCKKQFKINGMF